MGNCCGKASGSGNFQGDGRTLNAAPANAPAPTNEGRATIPASGKISSPKGGKTLGSKPQTPSESAGPKAAAARAAEERAKASQGKGKLGKALDAQRSQTQANTLAQSARDNVAARDADAVAETRNYN